MQRLELLGEREADLVGAERPVGVETTGRHRGNTDVLDEMLDEGDKVEDMQELARQLWAKRAHKMGLVAQP